MTLDRWRGAGRARTTGSASGQPILWRSMTQSSPDGPATDGPATDRAPGNDALTKRARAVLDANWIDGATKPAPRLYPHQWSWDSAFIAIGNRHHRWDRAATELHTLFEAQWTNGMVPHIVFNDGTPDYFPGPSWWDSKSSPHCPDEISSSGICQPPVHATAVRLVVEAPAGADRGRELAEALVPGLDRWHRYLHRTRAVDGPLIETWHPWESGRDNNPEWDAAMAAVDFDPATIPPYQRADTTHADPADRPSDDEYDTYLHLVHELQRRGYQADEPAELGFRIRDVLMNALLARAEADLAALCELIGVDGDPARERSAALSTAIHDHLWWPETGLYHSMDARTGQLVPTRTSGAFLPMLVDGMDDTRRSLLADNLRRDFLVPVDPDGAIPLTIPVDEPGFEPNRYWRGPSWINMAWMIANGLEHQGLVDDAARVRRGITGLCGRVGMFEYFDPRRGTGHGSDDFSWSAALALDIVTTTG